MIQSETTVRKHMGRTLWYLATEVIVKILSDASSQRCATDDREDLRERIARKDRANSRL